jgi:ribosomal protein S16
MKNLYKLRLYRLGRYKKAYYNINVVNKKNKLITKIGSYNPFLVRDKKKIFLNFFLFFFWVSKGLKPCFFLALVIKYIFLI